MKVCVIIARYKTVYEDYASYETLGVFTDEDAIRTALQSYKDRKIKHNAECLLADTSFIYQYFNVNEINNTTII